MEWRFSRSSGPGGQHVNTSDTRAELICDLSRLEGPDHLVTRVREKLGDEVRVIASAERSQLANRRAALARLTERLDAATVRPRTRRPTRPSKGAVAARLDEKRRLSQRKASRRLPTED